MKSLLKTFWLCLIVATLAGTVSADVIFTEDFSDDPDGPLAAGSGGVAGWEAQNDWTVSGGMAVNSGSWQRARAVGDPFGSGAFNIGVGEQVKISATLSLMGAGDGGNMASIGFSNTAETTGQVAPQVKAFVDWNGMNLAIGGATDTSYTSGDLINAMFTFTRNAGSGFTLDTMLTNLTTGLTFNGSTIGNDVAGMGSSTVWDNFDAGGDAYFSLRNLDNNTGATFGLSSVTVETIGIPEPASALVISMFAIGAVSRRRR